MGPAHLTHRLALFLFAELGRFHVYHLEGVTTVSRVLVASLVALLLYLISPFSLDIKDKLTKCPARGQR
ncbi:hypothetical protein KOW79_006176 [Hemibagrus wyckioides]|uniref:Uncharacterized protein n=1 Tax=Hemibagrus wyckioides TaxID=337641 RepID=A0A9D3NXD5_9TELE|nr:hypothetical protein KOW79_006176 [Hemibagrus wyckioides]